MLKTTKKVISLACSAVLLLSSLPINAIEIEAEDDLINLNENLGACQPIDEEIIQEHLCERPDYSSMAEINGAGGYPDSVDLSTSVYFPPTMAMGNAGSTASFSCVYYQFNYEANKLNGVPSNSNSNLYSPKWPFYSLIYSSGNRDASADKYYSFLKEHGALHLSDNPYSTTLNVNEPAPTDEAKLLSAMGTRLSNWSAYFIPSNSTDITSYSDPDLFQIKALLSGGKLLRVESSNRWATVESPTYGTIVTMGLSKGSFANFSGILCGYNDNVAIDINGDGTIAPCERGAFKLRFYAISGSYTDCWVMYDALNSVSLISGDWEDSYEELYRAPRHGVFAAPNSDRNYFYAINVANYPLDLVMRVRYDNTKHREPALFLERDNTATDVMEYNVETMQDGFYGTEVREDFTMFYDMATTLGFSIPSGFNSRRYIAYFGNSTNSSSTLSIDSISLIDSEEAIVKTLSQTSTTPLEYTADLDFDVGDLNYNGSRNTIDLAILRNYINGTRELSTIQQYLADVDGDGVIDDDDISALMTIIANG